MNLIFLGPQTSGKGTQAELLSKKLNLPLLTTGDIFRKKKMEGTEEGRLIASFIDVGELVPDEIANRIVREELDKNTYGDNGIIFDGYPRNLSQAKELEKYCAIDRVIFLDIPDGVVLKRLAARRVCDKCGAIYNLASKPPVAEGVCDKCGGSLVQRHDDTESAIAVRLNIYHKLTEPLIEHYEALGKLIRIDGTKDIETVHGEIIQKLENRN